MNDAASEKINFEVRGVKKNSRKAMPKASHFQKLAKKGF